MDFIKLSNDRIESAPLDTNKTASLTDEHTGENNQSQSKEYYWFMANPIILSTPIKISTGTGKGTVNILPEEDPSSDRIIEQLLFVPSNTTEKKNKTVLLYAGAHYNSIDDGKYYSLTWGVFPNQHVFEDCPVNTCAITEDGNLTHKADLIMFHYGRPPPKSVRVSSEQVFMIHYHQGPLHDNDIQYHDIVNWTSTYKHDSTIPRPYGKWVYYDPNVRQIEQTKNHAQNKTKMVAWMVSDSSAHNNRMEYARELQKYIQVDIYGHCTNKSCGNIGQCHEMLKDYKFYLAFENCNCREYITEKFYHKGLNIGTLPIVMGAHPDDYAKYGPEKSYIHVEEFRSAKELAAHLHFLNENDEAYNSYFKWKGTGELIDTHFWCRLCAMLHDDHVFSKRISYPDVNKWWHDPNICAKGYWRDQVKINVPLESAMTDQKLSVEDENSLKQKLAKPNKVPEEKIKLWYFQGGKLYPNQSEVSKKTGKWLANVLPEENTANNYSITIKYLIN